MNKEVSAPFYKPKYPVTHPVTGYFGLYRPYNLTSLFLYSAVCTAMLVKTIFMNALIKAIAACKVIALKSLLGKNTTGEVTAKAGLTHDIDGFFPIQLPNPLPQIV